MRFSAIADRMPGRIQLTDFSVPLALIPFFGNRIPPQALQITLVSTLVPLGAVNVTLLAVDVPLVAIDIALVSVLVAPASMFVSFVGVMVTGVYGFAMLRLAIADHDLFGTLGHQTARLLSAANRRHRLHRRHYEE
jgi:hypothetical protein